MINFTEEESSASSLYAGSDVEEEEDDDVDDGELKAQGEPPSALFILLR